MFKGIFSKYVSVFMLIIVVSFAILASIIGAMIFSYSEDSRKNIIANSSEAVCDYVETEYIKSRAEGLSRFVYFNYSDLAQTLTMFTSYESDIIILVTDGDGGILITDKTVDRKYTDATLPVDVMQKIKDDGEYSGLNDFGGVFSEKFLVHGVPVRDAQGGVIGAVFSCSYKSALTELAGLMIKTIITAMLWVMFAALLAVYFISERNIAPLKQMSRAAKEFASGNFKVRVPVKGNDEITELSAAFNNMASSLENLEDLRSSFLANVSHDLRTPMTSISGFIDGILDGAIPPEKYNYYLNIIRTEVKRLSRLVSSLLDLSKFESGEKKLQITEFDICEMARQILISFEKKIDEKKLDVEFDCDAFNIYVKADRDAVYQILYNICDNAVKFSSISGKYRISIKQTGKKVFVSVYNEGQGISSEDLPYVFDRFYKSDKSRGLDKMGVGLGLYISKTIIDAHKQEIWVKSVYGEYCEFVFTLEAK